MKSNNSKLNLSSNMEDENETEFDKLEIDDTESTVQNMVIDMKLDMIDYIRFYNLPLLQYFDSNEWIEHILSYQS